MQVKGNRVIFDGADIAAAFGRPNPYTNCGACGHQRHDHRREVIEPGVPGREEHYECERRDRRRKTGKCSCPQFTDPIEED